MQTLKTAMEGQGHAHIDLLKMDIEGAEYRVLADIVREHLPVRQMLIEFHHQYTAHGTSSTREALTLLENAGMKICHVCPRMEVFTLVHA